LANIVVKKLNSTPIEELPVEIVERKGIGHPITQHTRDNRSSPEI